jgi:hypothetical protein
MPAPKSPLRLLAERLAATTALRAIRCQVLLGGPSLARQGSPPRIVLEPTAATHHPATDQTSSLGDDHQVIRAHLWAPVLSSPLGVDFDGAWDLRQRYEQALEEQAAGLPGGAAGFVWSVESLDWDEGTDTAQDGLALIVTTRLVFPVLSAAGDEGRVPGQWPRGLVETVSITPKP